MRMFTAQRTNLRIRRSNKRPLRSETRGRSRARQRFRHALLRRARRTRAKIFDTWKTPMNRALFALNAHRARRSSRVAQRRVALAGARRYQSVYAVEKISRRLADEIRGIALT